MVPSFAVAPWAKRDRAIAPGTEEFLKGRGGLRAKILADGELRSTARIAQVVG